MTTTTAQPTSDTEVERTQRVLEDAERMLSCARYAVCANARALLAATDPRDVADQRRYLAELLERETDAALVERQAFAEHTAALHMRTRSLGICSACGRPRAWASRCTCEDCCACEACAS